MNQNPDRSTVPWRAGRCGCGPVRMGVRTDCTFSSLKTTRATAGEFGAAFSMSAARFRSQRTARPPWRRPKHGLPDVVLLDIGLPGMDGYGVARWITEQPCDKRPLLIAVTGLGREEDRRQSAAAGIDLHLVKPVEANVLQGLLSRFQAIIM